MLGFLKKFIPFAFIIALVLYLLSFVNGFEEVMPFAWICFGLFCFGNSYLLFFR
ncbi:MAG: hypothetical protein IPL12_23585 [Bacteroidetes bacterium]|nr:hypothetical protein [Bacteroidota bacterium]